MEADTTRPCRPNRVRDVALFIALLTTALAMGAAHAHALELPNKMALDRDAYFTVQTIYSGWNRLAFLLAGELAAMVTVAISARREPWVIMPTLAALGCLVAAQAIFWIWTYPTNAATANWTTIPEGWESLRAQWEYSHLAGAGFQVLAMIAMSLAALGRGRPARDRLEP